jgi:hypothetical protein
MPGSQRASDSLPHIALVVVPPILMGTTAVVFKGLAARFGPARGYLGGFL